MTSHRDHAAYELAYVVGKRLADEMIAAVCDEYADDLIEALRLDTVRIQEGSTEKDHDLLDGLDRAADLIRQTKTEGT